MSRQAVAHLVRLARARVDSAYSGQRDRSFRSIVTAAHELMLRGQILMPAVTMARYFSPF